jgi:hypothetical protein
MWTARVKRIERLRQRVAIMTDPSGTPMDPGIQDAVVALRLHGFPTSASCAGHLDGQFIAPWVLIEPTSPKKLQRRRRVSYLTMRRKRLEWRLLHLLSRFYHERFVAEDVRLHIEGRHTLHSNFCLTNQGREAVETLLQRGRQRKHRQYQEEMQAFATFLLSQPP